MIACLDVDYRVASVVAACVTFRAWDDATAASEHAVLSTAPPAKYEPGSFYKRELPYLLDALGVLLSRPSPLDLTTIVIDGYVLLEGDAPGLGAHLGDTLGWRFAVVGVAKRPFRTATNARAVVRGAGLQPLYVTAKGINLDVAAEAVQSMHGPYRTPTLLKRVDRLSRDAFPGA